MHLFIKLRQLFHVKHNYMRNKYIYTQAIMRISATKNSANNICNAIILSKLRQATQNIASDQKNTQLKRITKKYDGSYQKIA